MTMENDLVERPYNIVAWAYSGPRGGMIAVERKPAHAPEARALVDLSDLTTANARIQVLEADLARKTEALRPFADKSKAFDDAADQMGFARSFDEYRPRTDFTHGQLRAARSALEEKTDV